ncbi:hypothetical protein [Alicyclobacillus acidocaldarius]|uniref:Uncharacterized protein n=1 Tax=Alicyclobacillus acidocaldarius (strain Tc-4-1) TaxID=1048834 RepID=F8IL97_ALIAT|nr:hypothetical protein [Alicyclobacillus acidocaldarius]AEJ43663.1 hypothetical protein TC41_1736 [Alicyclobacillus acidocaldarius subsp. acidocaldarius Tc-4-1]
MAFGEVFKGLVYATIGLLLLIFSMTLAATGVGYFELRRAAEAAAWSGQSQIEQDFTNSSEAQGYFSSGLQETGDPVETAEQQFQSSAQAEHLSNLFQGLQAQVTVQSGEVTVEATGTLELSWLSQAFQAIMGGNESVNWQVPMRVTVTGGSV